MTGGVERELDVLRGAECVFDLTSDRGELQHLGIAEDGCASPNDVLVDRTRIGVDRVVVGSTEPDTTASPSPAAASTTARPLRPVIGSAVNRTPAALASTMRWTTTARPTPSSSNPWSRR